MVKNSEYLLLSLKKPSSLLNKTYIYIYTSGCESVYMCVSERETVRVREREREREREKEREVGRKECNAKN